jgi:hypothetical protein
MVLPVADMEWSSFGWSVSAAVPNFKTNDCAVCSVAERVFV